VKYVELEFEAETDGPRSSLPPFLGATIRGALGYLLKQSVCQIAHGDCRRCVLHTVCAYTAIFEGLAPQGREIMRKYDKIPQPFVLLVPEPKACRDESSVLNWGVRLFGEATRYWPYLVHVFQIAGERGLGRLAVTYRLRQVTDRLGNVRLWSPEGCPGGQPTVQEIPTTSLNPPDRQAIRWKFRTPVRVPRASGRLVGLDLVLAGRRRFCIMDYFYGGHVAKPNQDDRVEAEEFTTIESRLRPWRLDRYSGRQRQRMSLDGLLGDIVIEGPWSKSGAWFHAVPFLHLGKATSFGFGRVAWEVV